MALLNIEERKKYFKELGLGEYNEASIRKMQSRYMLRSSDADGIYGENSDNLLRHLMNCHLYLKPENFKPEEFRCGCGGRYCCGYPTYMKPAELMNVQSIRTHFGKPMAITCGVRCPKYNAEVGGIPNSEHKVGLAVDYYIAGVTDTEGNRRESMEWIKDLPNHHYTYGDGRFVETANGRISRGWVSAPGMGNAMHTDSYDGTPGPAPTPTPPGKIVVDGIIGPDSVKRAQLVFGTLQDGIVSGQRKDLIQVYFPSLIAVSYNSVRSTLVEAIQKWAGCTADSVWGKDTSAAVQRKLLAEGYDVGPWGADGIFGKSSATAFQKWLNDHDKPTPTPPGKDGYLMVDVSEFQKNIDWSKVKAAGVKGVMIRVAGRGGESGNIYDDVRFAEHIKGAHKAGLPVGIYFLTQAINAAEGKAEAAHAIKKWAETGIPISYPICIDSEDVTWENKDGSTGYGRANSNRLSKAKRTEAVKAFAEECKRQGYASMIYASTSWLYNQVDMSVLASLLSVWCAQWASSCQYTGKYIIWQYTNQGNINGIGSNVDLNKCYVDPKKVDPPKPSPTPTPGGKYPGKLPTEAEIREASNLGTRVRICVFARKTALSGEYHYVRFSDDEYTHECPVCHPRNYDKGGNCIWWPFFCWHHGGLIPCACSCGVIYNGLGDRYYDMSDAEVLASMKQRIGINDIKLVRNGNKPIPASMLQTGDALMFYTGSTYAHMGMYIGNGLITDNTSGRKPNIEYGESYAEYNKEMPCLFAIHYTGSLSYLQKYDEGTAVKELQDFMIWGGWLAKGENDGSFRDKTEAAVIAMQKAFGIKADGLAGADTFAHMRDYRK